MSLISIDFIIFNYLPVDISQITTAKRTHSKSQPDTESPVVKKQKTNAIKSDHSVMDTLSHNTLDLFDQSDASKSKVTVAKKPSPLVTTESAKTDDRSTADRIISEKACASMTNNGGNTNKETNSRTNASSSDRRSTAAGGGSRVIKIKRKKLPTYAESVDAPTGQLQKSTPEPDIVTEPQFESTELAL